MKRRLGLAEITVKINVNSDVDLPMLRQWLEDGVALDAPLLAGYATELQPFQDDTGEQMTNASVADAAQANGAASPVRRTGRRTNAEKAAERQAAQAAASPPAPAAPPQDAPSAMTQAVDQARQGGIALPPGITLPGHATQQAPSAPVQLVQPQLQPQPQVQQPTQVAMPAAQAPVPMPNGGVSMEDFREAYRQYHTATPGKPFMLMKAAAWPNGEQKNVVFTAESVPEADRLRYLTEWAAG